MSPTLSEPQLEQYDRDGILFPLRVFSPEDVASFRGALEAIFSINGSLKRLDNLHLFFDWAHRLVRHKSLLDAIEGVLGSDILVFSTLVFYKPPRDPGYASWHQDSFYSGLHLTPSTSAWIALTASHTGNGCMQVIPRSHRLGQINHTNVRDEANLLRRGEQIVAVDEALALDVVLQPGQMSLHQSTIIHGSRPNGSDEPRMGFIVRFVTNQIKSCQRPLLRVRGEADCSHLILADPPLLVDQRSAFTAWRAYSNANSNR